MDNLRDVRDKNDNQPIKDIVMKLIVMKWALDFYVNDPHSNCGDKKPLGLRPTNLNPLFEINLHRFT